MKRPTYGIPVPIDWIVSIVAEATRRGDRFSDFEAVCSLRLHVDASLRRDPVPFPKRDELAKTWRWTTTETRRMCEARHLWLTAAELTPGSERAEAWAAVELEVKSRGGRAAGQRQATTGTEGPQPGRRAAVPPGLRQDDTRNPPGFREAGKGEPAESGANPPGSHQDSARIPPGSRLAGVSKRHEASSMRSSMTPQPLTGGEGLPTSTEEREAGGPRRRLKPPPALVAAAGRWLDRYGQSVMPLVHSRDTRFGQTVRKALLAANDLPDGARATLVTEALVLAAQGGAGAARTPAPAPSSIAPVMPSPRAELVAPWAVFLDRLRDLLDSTDDVAAFEAWAVPVDWDGAVFVVAVPNVHAVDWISGVAGQLLTELAPEVLGRPARFAFQPPLFDEQHQAVGR